METLIFGTKNEAKIKQIGGVLLPIGIKVIGLPENSPIPTVEESGKTAVENACKKALTYAKLLDKPVFSMDNVLHLNGLKPEEQASLLHLRRIKGNSIDATDEEVVEHFSKIIERLGGKTNGFWEYGICIANPNGTYKETLIKEPRIFVKTPSPVIQPGYPMSSLQIVPETGRYMSEMSKEELNNLWQKSIGQKIVEFVQNSL